MNSKRLEKIELTNVIELTLETGQKIYFSEGIEPDVMTENYNVCRCGAKDRIMVDECYANIYDSEDDECLYDGAQIYIKAQYEPA